MKNWAVKHVDLMGLSRNGQARAWNFKMGRSGLLDIKLFQLPASVKLEYMGQHKKFSTINYTFNYWKQMYCEQTVLFLINKYDNFSNCKQLTGPVFRGKNLSKSVLAEFGINKQLLYNILDQFILFLSNLRTNFGGNK